MEVEHLPVLKEEVVGYLKLRPSGTYVDGTLGGGGHTRAILEAAPDTRVVALDVDDDAIREVQRRLEGLAHRVTIVRENYKNIKLVLQRLGLDRVDGVVLDLGVSSYQLERTERGFSFRRDAPLDMRMDRRQRLTACELVNELSESDLEEIFRLYGEERRARSFARAIARARKTKPIKTTGELADIIMDTLPERLKYARIHPATRVFQALRIVVNRELDNLETGLREAIECLNSGGRIVVISFHSLEDRIVKNTFKELEQGCVCPPELPQCVCGRSPVLRIVTKKVVLPSLKEVEENPRARSARLRAAEKL